MTLPRPEYPRPQLRRERWCNLNGVWRFAFDDGDTGTASGWQSIGAAELEGTIVVPFCPQSTLSGIGDPRFHDVAWYGRTFAKPRHSDGERVVLRFGAVDYHADVWVNGQLVASHDCGHTPFSADVTDVLVDTANALVVRAQDPGRDPSIPRGKQDWKEQPSHIFYSRTTGIWQTVWLWSPGHPALYDLTLEVVDAAGRVRDVIESYFGLRTIAVAGDRLHLNGEPIFLRLVLDQGYWPDGLMTAPTDEALRRDRPGRPCRTTAGSTRTPTSAPCTTTVTPTRSPAASARSSISSRSRHTRRRCMPTATDTVASPSSSPGLLTADRRPKIPLERINAVIAAPRLAAGQTATRQA